MKKLPKMRQNLNKLSSCERGAVAPLVGVCAILLVGAVAVAVDIGRGQVAQSKLQAALDSAGLAAGAMVGQNLDEEHLKPEAQKYLDANFVGSTIGATIQTFDLDLSEDQSIVTLNATASLPTTFMKIFGRNTMQVAAQTEITRETTGLEVSVVVDITGSMNEEVGGSPVDHTHKINALRTAGKDLINILFGSHATVDDLWVGVVPFSQTVNIGTDHAAWMSDLTNYTDQIYCSGPTSGTPKCPTDALTINAAGVSTRTNPITRVDRYMFSSNAGWYFSPHSWRGCILERWASGKDITDDTADTEKWATYFVPDTSTAELDPFGNNSNNWRSNAGNYQVALDRDGNTSIDEHSANAGCPENPITPLTNVKADLITAFDNLLWPTGNTHINVGAAWGWRLISPKWRDKWGGAMDTNNLPLDYDEPLSQKAMILMTDGINTMGQDMTAYGWLNAGHLGTTSSSTATTKLNTKTKAICDAMKAKGVLIYSIVFGNGSDTTSKNMMKYCASQADYYFFSPSAAALQTAFRAIGDSLSKLRVSK